MNADKIMPQSASESAADISAIEWITAADNPWGVCTQRSRCWKRKEDGQRNKTKQNRPCISVAYKLRCS